MTTLTVHNRDEGTKPHQLRAEGLMPAVYYGKKEPATAISMPRNEFIKVWNEAGESTVITLKRDDGDDVDVLIHDVQVDPVTEFPLHADFYAFERGKAMEISIPLEFVGEAPAVKNLGGMLVKVLHELSIRALPKHLPHDIKVDVSGVEDFESQILAKDIELPQEVELAEDPEEVVALVNAPQEEEPEEEEAGEVDFSEIEVEKKGKEEEEGEEEAGEE